MGLKGVIAEVETDLAWAEEEALALDRPAAHEMALNEQGEDHARQRSDHGGRRHGGPGALDLPAMVAVPCGIVIARGGERQRHPRTFR
jgi:hypothetical protein